ncbi:hypothetical protein [Sphingopyxis granuli]|uniref:hypothetical protein n=1 Tax=Sphingopyxis granuli TaxID=267128 RepID=UPI00082A18F7|nr:hypothetical protein [Sphingopyxis granuli]
MSGPFWIEIILALAIVINPIALLIYRAKAKKADGTSFGLGVRVVQAVCGRNNFAADDHNIGP